MKNLVVVSGAAGMTGSLVAEKLLAKQYYVIGFDNFFAGSHAAVERISNNQHFEFFEYNQTNEDHMNELFARIATLQNVKKEIVNLIYINCAAVVHTKHFYNPDDTFAVNVLSMRDTLERSINSNFYSYVNCSTSEVYSMKSWVDGGVREDSPVVLATAEQSLRTSYAAGKLMTEFFLRDAVNKGQIKGCSIRFANVYSADEESDEHIIPHIISSLIKNNKVELLENAKETIRTFLSNQDSCNAVISLLECPGALDGSIYNVGTEEEIAVTALVDKVANILGLEDTVVDFIGVRTADPLRRLLNTEKIKSRTGWTPKVTLNEGLRECIEFRRKRGF